MTLSPDVRGGQVPQLSNMVTDMVKDCSLAVPQLTVAVMDWAIDSR